MPRSGKKAVQRGSRASKAPARGGRNSHSSTPVGKYSGTSTPVRGGHQGLTLQEEARNTERHHGFWNTDTRLRHSNVNFVRGGSLEPPPEIEKATDSLADMAIAIEPADHDMVVEVFEEADNPTHANTPAQDLFYVDTQPTTVSTGLPPPRVTSPTPSDSGSDVILFGGRDEHGRPVARLGKPATTISDPVEVRLKQVEEQLHKKEELLEEVLHHQLAHDKGNRQKIIVESRIEVNDNLEVEVEEEIDVEVRPHKEQSRRDKKQKRGRGDIEQSEEDALIADYLANMDEDPNFLESFGNRELGGSEDGQWQDDTKLSSSEPHHTKASQWDRDDINDFDDLSTSDGVMGDVTAILSKRERISGLQYLVVWEQQSIDEARWVPMTTLISVNAQLQIEKFEDEEKLVAEFLEASDSDEDSTDSDDDDADSIDAPPPREPVRISDEKIARLLAKQQELGIDVDELVLFDGEGDDEDDEDAIFAQSFIPVTRGRRNGKVPNRSTRRAKGEYPVASLLADAYDGYDVMDFDRPSLKKKPKGRKGKLVFDLSDSELEAGMVAAWENDRIKKKERKQDREELRAQGLLGNKNGKANMRDKYKEGMGMPQIKEEIKLFLQSDHTTLALPPMEKEERKSVHQLAVAFNLKSKSDGSGKKRFPVIYKTQRTQPFSDLTFDAIASGMSRRFLKRPDVKGRKVAGGRDRGGNMGAVSYRDGDVVGASAAELGVENRGRAMLEKMGWSKGTALGALNNKGILQPISHVVKTSKAGLG